MLENQFLGDGTPCSRWELPDLPGKRFRGERVEGLIGSIHCGGRSVCGKILGEVGGNNGRVQLKPILPGDTNHHLPRLGQFFAIIGSVRIAASMAAEVYFHFGTGQTKSVLENRQPVGACSRSTHFNAVPGRFYALAARCPGREVGVEVAGRRMREDNAAGEPVRPGRTAAAEKFGPSHE